MIRYQTIIAAALGLSVTALVNSQIRKDTVSGINEDTFYLEKTFSEPYACNIAAGDSRIMYGFIPPNDTWQNFGYPAAGWNTEYLDAIEGRFAKNCKKRTLVLGVTHLTMTDMSEVRNKYLSIASESAHTHRLHALTWPITRFFDPIAFADLKGGRGEYFDYEYYKNGWAKSDMTPKKPELGERFYNNRFRQMTTPERIETRLLNRVKIWIADGIDVVAMRPPSSPEVRAIEDELSGHSTADFSKALSDLGVRWLEMPNIYETYDGSHLSADAAKEFSDALIARVSADKK